MSGAYDIRRPDFQRDLKHGQDGEALVNQFIEDICSGHLEVKTDRYRNGRMVVEVAQNPKGRGWKPSGLMVTEAKWWVYQYNLDGAFTIVSVARLKRYIETNKDNMEVRTFGTRGDNHSRGYLLMPEHVTDLMVNPEYDEVYYAS
jgi:hypothetical protein